MGISTMFGEDRQAERISVKKTTIKTPNVKVVSIIKSRENEHDRSRKFFLFSDSKNP